MGRLTPAINCEVAPLLNSRASAYGVAPTSGPDPKTVEARRDAAILAEWRKQQGRDKYNVIFHGS